VRLLLGLAALLLLAGCGAVTNGSAPAVQPSVLQGPAPPIVPVDEPPPPVVQQMLDDDFGLGGAATSYGVDSASSSVIFTWGRGGTTTPTAAQTAEARAQFAKQRQALRPAADSPPRVVARLPLDDGGEMVFVVWHNRDGELCTFTNTSEAKGGGGGSMGNTCGGIAAQPCAAICLSSGGTGAIDVEHWTLSGTVASDADAIDVTNAVGTTTEYPLTGPVVDGDRRVVMLDLGAQNWRKLVLVRDGNPVADTAMPAAEVSSETCMQTVGPAPPPPQTSQSPAVKAWNAAYEACLEASGTTP
jgi:hypothetical protein